MDNKIFKYHFDDSVPAQELEDTFILALLAVKCLHGILRTREECQFCLDSINRTCVIDASTSVGNDLDRIFAGFAAVEYGERLSLIERIQPPITTMEGVHHD